MSETIAEPVKRNSKPEERFWMRTLRKAPTLSGQPAECWLWQGAILNTGYGQHYVDNKAVPAHRYSYELHIGPIPEGLELDHS